MYLVMIVEKTKEVNALGVKRKIELCWSDGMIGAVSVFEKKEDAERYKGKVDAQIVEVSDVAKGNLHDGA